MASAKGFEVESISTPSSRTANANGASTEGDPDPHPQSDISFNGDPRSPLRDISNLFDSPEFVANVEVTEQRRRAEVENASPPTSLRGGRRAVAEMAFAHRDLRRGFR